MRTMASSCLWPQETFPAFYCSYKGVFFHPDSCHPHLPHSRHLLPPPTALSVLPCSGPHPHTLAPRQLPSWVTPEKRSPNPRGAGGRGGGAAHRTVMGILERRSLSCSCWRVPLRIRM